MTLAPRPRGRRPGRDDTRGTIRAAAARLFQAHGYEQVSLRSVAREAGVDPALVHHYFSSKADLFCRATLGVTSWDIPRHLQEVLAGPREEVGRRAVRSFFEHWDVAEAAQEYVTTLGPDAADGSRAVTEMMGREIFQPTAAHFGHANAALRGQLAASALLGVMVSRHHLDVQPLASLSLRTLITPLGRTLQHYLVEPW